METYERVQGPSKAKMERKVADLEKKLKRVRADAKAEARGHCSRLIGRRVAFTLTPTAHFVCDFDPHILPFRRYRAKERSFTVGIIFFACFVVQSRSLPPLEYGR